MNFSLVEIKVPDPNNRGYTYDVTRDGEILVCASYTRHSHLARLALRDSEEIAWGGVLSAEGQWVRGSIDFGDAPDEGTRQQVINAIRNYFSLKPEEDVW